MRPLLFLVADKDMEYVLRGFFARQRWYESIRCGAFEFDVDRDILVAAGNNDPGIYKRGADLLGRLAEEYRHVVVMLDARWDGSPGEEAIRQKVQQHIEAAGWPGGRGLALVLVPEVDIWLWADSPHAAKALGWGSSGELWKALTEKGMVAEGGRKPSNPKEAAEWALKHASSGRRRPRSSSIYREIASKVSVARCEDPALRTLVEALRRWFPPGEPAGPRS